MSPEQSPIQPTDLLAGLTLKGRLKYLFRDSAIYGTASAISRLFSLLTFPVLTRYFSVQDYGFIDAFMVLISLLSMFMSFGQDSAVARFFYEYDDLATRRQVISQSVFIQVVTSVALVPLLWVFSDSLSLFYTGKQGLSGLCRLGIVQAPFALYVSFCLGLLKWTFARSRFLIMSIGSTVVNTILILFSVFILKVDLTGLFWMLLIVQILFAGLGVYLCRDWLELPRGIDHVKSLLLFGCPYGLIHVIAGCIPALDRLFVSRFLGSELLGLYAVGYKIALLLSLPIQAFQTAWGPFYMSIFKEKNAEETYNHILLYFTVFICMAVLLLSFSAEPVIRILASSRYLPASGLVLPLALGFGFQACGWIPSIGVDLAKKSYLNFFNVMVSIIATAGAIWGLIGPFGMTGVAWGVCIGYAMRGIVHVWMAYNVYPLRFSLGKPFCLIAATAATGLLGTSLVFGGSYGSLILRAFLLIMVAVFVWIAILTQKERSVVLRFCRLQRA